MRRRNPFDNNRRLRRIIIPAILAAGSVLIAGCGAKTETPKAAAATMAASPAPTTQEVRGTWITAQLGTIREYAPAVGSFQARRTTQIGSQVSGRVSEVLVDVGDTVRKDQVLVRLDPIFFEIEVAQAKAQVEAARVAMEDTKLNWERMRNLWEKPGGQGPPSVSRKAYDDAKLALNGTGARLAQAREGLRYAEQRLKETVIRAPYDAVVARRLVDPGEPVTSAPATYLLHVQEVASLNLEFSLPQTMLGRVRAGTEIQFTVEGTAGGPAAGKIAVVFPTVDETTRSFKSRAIIPNPDLKYRPGLLARVRVVDRQVTNAVVIPRNAATQTATGWQVSASNDGHPVPRDIQVGIITDDQVEVQSGLKPGDKVFIRSGS